MSDSVFDQNADDKKNESENNIVAPDSSNTFDDKLKGIVDENGKPKYDSVAKALDALVHSQDHIKQLEAEKSAINPEIEKLREKAAQADALEEIVKRLQQSSPTVENKTPSNAGTSDDATNIEAKLEELLNRRDAQSTAKANLTLVQDTLIGKFGDMEKTKVAVAQKAAELGMTPSDLAALSSKSPKAVLAYFDAKPATVNNPVVSTSNTQINPPNADDNVERPQKSLLLGATAKDQKEFMRKVKEAVYKRHGIEV